jgi:hypothetical protein
MSEIKACEDGEQRGLQRTGTLHPTLLPQNQAPPLYTELSSPVQPSQISMEPQLAIRKEQGWASH